MDYRLEKFVDQKYINLETYRKDQTSVKTPVWFIIENDQIHIITKETTGKVKRLRNNSNARIAICSMKGDVKSDWIDVKAKKIVDEHDVEKIVKLRKKKYGFYARLISIATSQKGKTIAYSIIVRDE
jgi:PPOX class probable F420-dependent enzyme|tara:strand:- start:50 stop:430 length:381 start_codon:yes stop_codon:yes gene_type:complete